MFMLRLLATCAVLATAATAQGIALTQWPSIAVAGNAYDIRWSGGDGSPVTIKLLTGNTANLQTVSTLTTNNIFSWIVPQSTTAGPNFALSIQDNSPNNINYIGPIELQGGSGNPISGSTSVQNAIPSVVGDSAVGAGAAGTAMPVYNATTTVCPTGTPAASNGPKAAAAPTSGPSIYPPIMNGAMRLAAPAYFLGACTLLCLYL
ncbi:MAG: hypothetical protein Q9160_002489 [Pyrenula sp. 1 TL-2023]